MTPEEQTQYDRIQNIAEYMDEHTHVLLATYRDALAEQLRVIADSLDDFEENGDLKADETFHHWLVGPDGVAANLHDVILALYYNTLLYTCRGLGEPATVLNR